MDESACVCVVEVYISTVCSIPPLLTSSADSLQSDGANLSQKVYGELIILVSWWRNVSVKSFPSNAERTDYPSLMRRYVSRRAAGNGSAVLEGVGLDAPTIETCFSEYSFSEEEAVQNRLIRWLEGRGRQPPTWVVLVEAMAYAQIDQHAVQGLKKGLGLSGMSLH